MIESPLFKAYKEFPNSPAVISNHVMLNYEQLGKIVSATIKKIKESGYMKQDKLSLVGDKSVENVILLWSLWHAGFTPVILSNGYSGEKVTNICRVLEISKSITADIVNLNEQIDEICLNEIDIESHVTIMFTSGTSSLPKAVLHSFGNHYYSALGSNENIKIQPGDRWLLSLPLYHVGGLAVLFRTALSAAAVVIDNENEIVDAVDRHKITHLSVVPTQLDKIIGNSDDRILRGLKAVLLGGGIINDELIEKSLDKKLPLYTSYGLTEASSQVTTTPPDSEIDILKTAGKPLKYRDLKISDDNEILIKGDILFKRYLNAEKKIDSNGWFHTGDLGVLDEDGYLIVIGRKDNMFISGGENIYPEEIESALSQLDNIEQAVVIPVENKKYGYRPVAFVKFKEGHNQSIDTEKLKLEKFKIPDKILPFPKEYIQTGIKPDRSYFKQLLKNDHEV